MLLSSDRLQQPTQVNRQRIRQPSSFTSPHAVKKRLHVFCSVADDVAYSPTRQVASPELPSYPTKAALDVALTERLDTEVVTETEMHIDGKLPGWLNGIYLKNGPGTFKGLRFVFDGYACVTKVRFNKGRAYFSSRYADTTAWRRFKKHGRPTYREFGTTLPFHLNLMNVWAVATGTGVGITDNCSVNILPIPGTREVHCLTEVTHGSMRMSVDSLETLGPVTYEDDIKDRLTTAHPAIIGDTIVNITSDIFKEYTVYRQKLGSSKREVITTVPTRHALVPSWIHQFPYTENYIIIPETPLLYSLQAMLGGGMSEYILFDWKPEMGSKLHIVRLADGHVVTVDAPTFCTFHYINTFETEDGHICFDFGWLDDPGVLYNFSLDTMRSGSKEVVSSVLRRMVVPIDGKGEVEVLDLTDGCSNYTCVETPTINPQYQCQPYQFVYSNSASGPCTFPNAIAKIDLVSRDVQLWHEGGSIPTEPLFVGRPGATEEDDGVLLSHVAGADGTSYLLVLDARSFQEVARVVVPGIVAYQYHGTFLWM